MYTEHRSITICYVVGMEDAQIKKEKKEIIKKYGEWTTHSILLAPDIYTIVGKEYPSGRPAALCECCSRFLTPAIRGTACTGSGMPGGHVRV